LGSGWIVPWAGSILAQKGGEANTKCTTVSGGIGEIKVGGSETLQFLVTDSYPCRA